MNLKCALSCQTLTLVTLHITPGFCQIGLVNTCSLRHLLPVNVVNLILVTFRIDQTQQAPISLRRIMLAIQLVMSYVRLLR